MLPVFITSNQIPLHVHAVFCQLHIHCIHLVRGMMRMRIPSINMGKIDLGAVTCSSKFGGSMIDNTPV